MHIYRFIYEFDSKISPSLGLIAFTKEDLFTTKKILSAALREGKKFMDLFLSLKSSLLVDAIYKYEVGTCRDVYLYVCMYE